MTKLEELESACVAAWVAARKAYAVYDVANDAYQAELNKENSND